MIASLAPDAVPQMPVADAPCEVLLVRVGGKRFGLFLADVRQVMALPVGFEREDVAPPAHFVFDGEPVAYVSLWQAFGLHSEYRDWEEMETVLPARRQDHLDWMNALEASLRRGVPFEKARSPHDCAFGKWLETHHTEDRRMSLLLNGFGPPHAAIHGLADRLLGEVAAGRREAALGAFEEARHSTLAKLLGLFDSAQTLVCDLQRRLAIVLARAGAETCTLGADAVEDIRLLGPGQLKAAGAGQSVAALAVLDARTVLPILDWPALTGAAAQR